LDATRNIGPAASTLESGFFISHSDEHCKLPAGRCACDSDSSRIDTVFFCVGAKVADGAFAIFDVCGERPIAAEPVEDAGRDGSLSDEKLRA
jgi:hypothetical protein